MGAPCLSRARRTVVVLVAALTAGGGGSALAAGPTGDPSGRGMQLLRDRESIVAAQATGAALTARARGRMLYRLLLLAAAERDTGSGRSAGGDPDRSGSGGRAISLALAVLDRDLHEAAELRAELGRVRLEEAAAATSPEEAALPGAMPAPDGATPTGRASPVDRTASSVQMLAPVPGAPALQFGVVHDDSTGAWLFRTAAGFRTKPRQSVRAPADGRVERVEADGGSGWAVVLSHGGGWITVLGGLGTVTVSPRVAIRRGEVLGLAPGRGATAILRVELWRGRQPIDPMSVLRRR